MKIANRSCYLSFSAVVYLYLCLVLGLSRSSRFPHTHTHTYWGGSISHSFFCAPNNVCVCVCVVLFCLAKYDSPKTRKRAPREPQRGCRFSPLLCGFSLLFCCNFQIWKNKKEKHQIERRVGKSAQRESDTQWGKCCVFVVFFFFFFVYLISLFILCLFVPRAPNWYLSLNVK